MSIMLVVAAAALVLRILTYKLLPDSCRNRHYTHSRIVLSVNAWSTI